MPLRMWWAWRLYPWSVPSSTLGFDFTFVSLLLWWFVTKVPTTASFGLGDGTIQFWHRVTFFIQKNNVTLRISEKAKYFLYSSDILRRTQKSPALLHYIHMLFWVIQLLRHSHNILTWSTKNKWQAGTYDEFVNCQKTHM